MTYPLDPWDQRAMPVKVTATGSAGTTIFGGPGLLVGYAVLNTGPAAGTNPSVVDTSTPLGIAGVFTGPTLTVPVGATSLSVTSTQDQAGTSTIQYSPDAGVTWITVASAATVAGTPSLITFAVTPGMLVREVYTNGGTAQGTFKLVHTFTQPSPFTDTFCVWDGAVGNGLLIDGGSIGIDGVIRQGDLARSKPFEHGLVVSSALGISTFVGQAFVRPRIIPLDGR
jgi:hypothetical protein